MYYLQQKKWVANGKNSGRLRKKKDTEKKKNTDMCCNIKINTKTGATTNIGAIFFQYRLM